MQKVCCAGMLFIIYSTFAIGQRQHKATDWSKDGLQGKVKSIAVKEYSAASDTSQQGDLLEYFIKNYDECGYLIEIKEFNDEKIVMQQQVAIYSKKRKQKEEMLYGEDGILLEKTITKLNSVGNPTQSIVINSQGKIQEKNTYQYDEKNRLLKQSGYDAKGKLSERSYYTYHNDVLNQYLSFSEFENKKILYKYDANKNPIEMMIYDSKTNAFLEKITQKFDVQKNIVETTNWDEKNVLKSITAYKYDEKGNQIEYIVLDSNKNIQDSYTFSYQYDKQGNWIAQTVYRDKEKQMESRTERIIEYYE